jgi:hypothetical protein
MRRILFPILFGSRNRARITLTDYSYPEDTAVNDVVAGILIDGAFDPAHHTFAISPSTTFDIWGGGDGDDLQLVGALNYEATTSYTIAITAYYDAVEIVTENVTVYVTDVDEVAPTITSANTANVAENATLAHALTANEAVTWSLVGGTDQADFELSGSTLRWAGNVTRDYELPDDSNTNNTYVVDVRATDTALNTTDQTITVTVTDVAEGGGGTAGEPMGLLLSITKAA